MEIPKKVKGNYHFPSIVDHISVLNEERRKLSEYLYERTNIRFNIFKDVIGYIIVCFKMGPEKIMTHGSLKIVDSLYKSYANERNDGFVDFVNDFRRMSSEEQLEIIYNSNCYDLSEISDLEILDLKVLYKMSFNRQFVDLKIAKSIISYIIDNVEITKRGETSRGCSTKYDYLMFNTTGPAGNWSLLHFYENYYTVDIKTGEKNYKGFSKTCYVYKFNLEGFDIKKLDEEDFYRRVKIKKLFV